ncbi:MAG: hypothetical protein IJA36_10445 [Lachnospiraceae bacterium]|nr:hypothetical protein [Lachnospiraceae bacterium]
MNEALKQEIDKKTLDMIEFGILRLERKNERTHEVSDGDMIKKICNIIEKEVERSK